MTNENLKISTKDLFELRAEFPLEVEVILDMLTEAGEAHYADEIDQLEYQLQAAA